MDGEILFPQENNKRSMIQITIRLRHSFIFIMFVPTFSRLVGESTTSSSFPSTNLINISRRKLFLMSDQANPIYNCSHFHPATKMGGTAGTSARGVVEISVLLQSASTSRIRDRKVLSQFSLLMMTLGRLLDKVLLILLMKQLRCH